ncbi:MAG: adenylosuccinate lyase [Thermodesulfovibrionales bacterium]|nr:adenylosuccinate lyase [Thermodesulfovibrionales bacterium]
MIERYTLEKMGCLWDLQNKYQKWLDVEIAVCEAWAELREIPEEALEIIKQRASFDVKRIDEIEATVKHDVIAFLTSVAENIGPESRFVHKGLTSSDVTDTALCLLMVEAVDIILNDLKTFQQTLKEQAFKFKDTPCIGRSHGVHAEPMTFGLKFALWYKETERNIERLKRAKETIKIGKISGAVGTFSNMPPEIEEKVCMKLGLTPEPVATQVIQRDRHAEFMSALAITATMIEKIGIEIRHLQRTEVREAEEPFTIGQKGSSAMPHKRNPVGCENLSGLARIVRANAIAAFENVALWHERDISHSSVERVIIPDSCILINYMINRLNNIIKNLHVYPENMKNNLEKSYGLYNSQRILLTLTEKGLTREEAYQIVQRNAMQSWSEGMDFKQQLMKDDELMRHMSKEELDEIFSIDYYLRHIDYIYKRVFDSEL